MGKLYAEYLRQEPEIMKQILASRRELAAPLLGMTAGRPVERLFFLGSGSSWHCGLICAGLAREALGVEVECLTSTMAERKGFPRDALYFAISQSGTSNSTLGLIRRAREAGGLVAALTADPESPAAGAADLTVPVLCGEERIGPKSKGVLATVLTLALLLLELGRAAGRLDDAAFATHLREWEHECGCVAQAAREGERFFREHSREIMEAPEWMLLAGAGQIGAARECALKMLETCWSPAYAWEFEEYMHGGHYTLGPGRRMFYFIPEGEERARMEALYRFSREQGAVCWALGLNGEADWIWSIPGAGGAAGALSWLAFFQALSNCCSEGRGIDCDVPRYPTFHQEMKTKTL